MRILEVILLLAITLLFFIKRPLLKKIKKKILIIMLVSVLIGHFIIEGWRWQMFSAYFLSGILVWRFFVIKEFKFPKLTFTRSLGYGGIILLLFLSWSLPNLLPVFSLPKPTGKYQVGTQMIHLQTTLEKSITATKDDTRELMLKIWYPAKITASAKQDPYLDIANRTSFITKYGGGILPPASMNYLDYIQTHVYTDVPVIEESFPVLLFSHGYGSNASGYYALLSEIASHGYIIINMNHTYESLATTFPDGREVFFDYEFQAIDSKDALKHIAPIKNAFKNNISYDKRHAMLREASKDYNITHMIKRWSKDMIYTIDQLEIWNREGALKNRLDLDKIGVFGHSRGGGAAEQVAIKDRRIKAAANIDGVQWGEMMDTIYHTPFLYISSDWSVDHENINAHVYKHKSTDYFYESKLLTSGHPNFMDIPFLIPVKSLAQTGDIDSELGIKITNELVLSFFNKHIKEDENETPEKVAIRYEVLDMTVYKNGIRVEGID